MNPNTPTAPSAEDVAGLVAKQLSAFVNMWERRREELNVRPNDKAQFIAGGAAHIAQTLTARLTEVEGENARLTRERDVANDAREAHAKCTAALIEAAELALSTSHAERDRAVAERDEARAQVAEAREAIRPFVDYVHDDIRASDVAAFYLVPCVPTGGGWLGAEDFRRARDFLRTLTPAQETSR